MLRAVENQGGILNLPAAVDTAWMHAPFGYFVTDAALDSLKSNAIPTCWIVPPTALLTSAERGKLLKLRPHPDADSAAKVSPLRASGRAKAWGFVDQDSSLVVVVTNTDSVKTTSTVSVSGLPPGTFSLLDALADTVLSQIPVAGSGPRSFQVTLASRETRPFVIQNAFGVAGAVIAGERRPRAQPLARFFLKRGALEFPRFDDNGNLEWMDLHGHRMTSPLP